MVQVVDEILLFDQVQDLSRVTAAERVAVEVWVGGEGPCADALAELSFYWKLQHSKITKMVRIKAQGFFDL